MKAPYMFMPLLIREPNGPTKDFNVYLRPLIDESSSYGKEGSKHMTGHQ